MQVETIVCFQTGAKSHKKMQKGQEATVGHRIPRVAKLMALALRFEDLIRDGVVADYADLARLGHVTRARMSQLMGLLNLAPDIIEDILFLRAVERGKDPITERDLRQIVGILDWKIQRRLWRLVVKSLETSHL